MLVTVKMRLREFCCARDSLIQLVARKDLLELLAADDCSLECNVRFNTVFACRYNVAMKDVLKPETRMVIPTLYDSNFMQDLMCTAPHNPVVKQAIEVAWDIRRTVPRVNGIASFRDHMTMVNSWTTGIELALFGRADVNMTAARAAIQKVPQLMTCVHSPHLLFVCLFAGLIVCFYVCCRKTTVCSPLFLLLQRSTPKISYTG